MPSLPRLIGISRPRFWMYLIGPYLLGVTAADPRLTPASLLALLAFAVFFTLPANLLVYGVNDIFDYETDRLNPKKAGYELLVSPDERRGLLTAIVLLAVPFMAVLARAHTAALAFLAAFVLLSVFYSAPPIRAKARPVIDSAFNILYAMPGLFGYALAGGGTPSAAVVVASACWTMAMHAYSAVPDIEADREAGLATIATLLGARATILLCLALYAASALLAYRTLGPVSAALGAVYGMLMLVSLRLREPSAVMAIYRRFPAVNAVCGFLIFLAIFLSHHLQM